MVVQYCEPAYSEPMQLSLLCPVLSEGGADYMYVRMCSSNSSYKANAPPKGHAAGVKPPP